MELTEGGGGVGLCLGRAGDAFEQAGLADALGAGGIPGGAADVAADAAEAVGERRVGAESRSRGIRTRLFGSGTGFGLEGGGLFGGGKLLLAGAADVVPRGLHEHPPVRRGGFAAPEGVALLHDLGGDLAQPLALVLLLLGARRVDRFNLFTSAMVSCDPAPGVSNAELMDEIERLKKDELGRGYGIAWTGLSWQEKSNAGAIGPLFALSVLMAYLFLVAQYESWMLPVPVVLSVATAVAGGLLALLLSGGVFDIYAQLGILMLVGLTAKTSILMVECSHARSQAGTSAARAAMTGLRLRFRAVLMTALSFVIGVLPLLFAEGPGAGARRAIGTVTFWGMLAATVVGVLLVPPLYVAFKRK